jgi:hypothetical protein
MPVVVPGPDPRALKAAISGGTSGDGAAMSNLSGNGTIDSGSTVSGWARAFCIDIRNTIGRMAKSLHMFCPEFYRLFRKAPRCGGTWTTLT